LNYKCCKTVRIYINLQIHTNLHIKKALFNSSKEVGDSLRFCTGVRGPNLMEAGKQEAIRGGPSGLARKDLI
jgi:hypothetical protein